MRHLSGINENFMQDHLELEDILTELNDVIKPLVTRPTNSNNLYNAKVSVINMSLSYSHYTILYNIPHEWDVDKLISFLNIFKSNIRRIESWCKDNEIELFRYDCTNGLRLTFTIRNRRRR